MKTLKTLKKTLYSACLYFTAAEFLLLFIAQAFFENAPQNGGTAGMFLSLGSSALLFVSCLITAAMNLVWRLEYRTPIKLLIHFIGLLAAYSVIFIVIPGTYTNVAQVLIRLFIFTAVYLVVAFACFVVGSIRKNRRSEQLEYEAQFNTKNN